MLEAYLNLAGFRGEAQGIGAAALGLFGKTPEALSRDDAQLLAALLPQPQATADQVANRSCRLAHENDCARFAAQAASMLGPARSLALDPGLAPHLADRLLKKPGLRITTTLDSRIQRLAIAALRRELQGLGSTRARDGGVVVLDNASGDVLAYVGGVGGASTAPAVDAANAYRQAGSTLKPFLYADAIEKGYLTAASILDDSPVQLDTASGLYVPTELRQGLQRPGLGAIGAGRIAQRAGGAHAPARGGRAVPRPAVGHRLQGPRRGRQLLRLQPRARFGRGDSRRTGRRLSQPRERRSLVAAPPDHGRPAQAAARDHHAPPPPGSSPT